MMALHNLWSIKPHAACRPCIVACRPSLCTLRLPAKPGDLSSPWKAAIGGWCVWTGRPQLMQLCSEGCVLCTWTCRINSQEVMLKPLGCTLDESTLLRAQRLFLFVPLKDKIYSVLSSQMEKGRGAQGTLPYAPPCGMVARHGTFHAWWKGGSFLHPKKDSSSPMSLT